MRYSRIGLILLLIVQASCSHEDNANGQNRTVEQETVWIFEDLLDRFEHRVRAELFLARTPPIFEYSLPEMSELPRGLRDYLVSDREANQASYDRAVLILEEQRNSPRSHVYGVSSHTRWQSLGSTDQLVSLGGQIGERDGGSGYASYRTIIWDKIRDQKIEPAALVTEQFLDPENPMITALQRSCRRALMQELAGRQNINRHIYQENYCSHQSLGYFTPSGEVEGQYTSFRKAIFPMRNSYLTFDVPITAEWINLIRPEYRDSFAVAD